MSPGGDARSVGPTRRRALLTAAVVLGSGCLAPRATAPFEGRYAWGFETSVFAPCGRTDQWWVADDAALVARYRELVDAYDPVFARVHGTLSDPGNYGQGGRYPRQLSVTKVVSVRRVRPDDCRSGSLTDGG